MPIRKWTKGKLGERSKVEEKPDESKTEGKKSGKKPPKKGRD